MTHATSHRVGFTVACLDVPDGHARGSLPNDEIEPSLPGLRWAERPSPVAVCKLVGVLRRAPRERVEIGIGENLRHLARIVHDERREAEACGVDVARNAHGLA
jgi:hypothetical protein